MASILALMAKAKSGLWDKEVADMVRSLYWLEGAYEKFGYPLRRKPKYDLRFIVTGNVSSGKSTLINALVGKSVMRTSQEACTASLCYILLIKPFYDNTVHLLGSPLNLEVNCEDIARHEKIEFSYIPLFYRLLTSRQYGVCLIDTPGVNSAINHEHGKLTRIALKEEKYDFLIYVFNANRLGTDEEFRHLKFVAGNVPKDKVIFVVNKLDDFNKKDDSIESSVEGVRSDLLSFGYENPVICPLSAYFALLIKLKLNGETLTADEEDEFNMYARKFAKPEYDLSQYYKHTISVSESEEELMLLTVKCGLYGLESTMYGGNPKK
jgi:GTPase SAR1 family protein